MWEKKSLPVMWEFTDKDAGIYMRQDYIQLAFHLDLPSSFTRKEKDISIICYWIWVMKDIVWWQKVDARSFDDQCGMNGKKSKGRIYFQDMLVRFFAAIQRASSFQICIMIPLLHTGLTELLKQTVWNKWFCCLW